MTATKAQPNTFGITWATSRSKRLDIALQRKEFVGGWQVWALYAGTHDLAPRTRNFTGDTAEADARAYANELWRTA